MTKAQYSTLRFLTASHEHGWERMYSCIGVKKARLKEFMEVKPGDFVVEYPGDHQVLILTDGTFARLPQEVLA